MGRSRDDGVGERREGEKIGDEYLRKLEVIGEIYSELGQFRKVQKTQTPSELLDVGYKTTFTKRIGYADVYLFSLVSGDWNPIHHDAEFAEKTMFGGRIAHGMLTSSLVSTALNLLPGTVVLLKSHQEYVRPVYLGDTITAEAEVVEKLPKSRYVVSTKCRNQRGETVVRGECVVMVLD